jgi:hypothetical protein
MLLVVLDIQVAYCKKRKAVVRRQAYVQFDSTNKYECTFENSGFLNDAVSTPEYAETMCKEGMFAELEVLRIT